MRGCENSAPMASPEWEETMNRTLLSAAAASALVLVVALSGCSPKKAPVTEAEPNAAIPVTVRGVSESVFVEYGEYFGRTEPAAGAQLVVPAGGRVQAVRVAEGDAVSAGQSLGSVSLDRAQAAYETAALNERIARDVYTNQKKFHEAGNVSRLVMDQAELAWRGAVNNRLDAERSLAGARCESPLSGIVLSRRIELHDEVPPGGIAFSVGEISSLLIRIGVSEADISSLRTGVEARISSSAYPGEEWTGRIERIDREPSAKTLTYTAVVRLDNADRRILPGVTAKVVVPRRRVEQAIVVPSEAIISDSSGAYAMVARSEADAWVARSVPVVRGVGVEGSTLVLRGLSAGDRLIVEGNHLLKDGAPISFDERLALASDRL